MIKIGINENIQKIREDIENTCIRIGRKNDVKIVAVTKNVTVDRIIEAINCGIKDIGENRVQELMSKIDLIKPKPKFHLIGHLQTNKVKYIFDKVELIQSLDRIELANEIEKRAKSRNIIVNTLIEVNISNEDSKFGVKEDELLNFIEELQRFDHIQINGLMTIGSNTKDTKKVRSDFRRMYLLREKIMSEKYDRVNLDILSMGMTNDYLIAIEEGSNMVRIGTGIFGKRNN